MRLSELTSLAYAPSTDRTRQFVNDVIMESELLRTLNNFSLGAVEDQYRPSAGSQSLAARALAGSYTAEDLSQANLQTAQLKMHGFILDYDEAMEKDHELGIGIDIDRWLQDELQLRSIDTADALESLIIAGDGQTNNFEGLATILDGSANIPGLGITGVIDADETGSSSFDLSDEANFDDFLELWEKWTAELKGGTDIVIMNRSFAARMTTIARKFHRYSWSLDQFGRRINEIDGIPIIRVEDSVITSTEDDNVGTPNQNTTSMYLAKNRVGYWDVKSNSGLATWDVGELPTEKMSRRWKFEMRGRNQIRHKFAIRRVRNIKL